jgi:hypothetical protein
MTTKKELEYYAVRYSEPAHVNLAVTRTYHVRSRHFPTIQEVVRALKLDMTRDADITILHLHDRNLAVIEEPTQTEVEYEVEIYELWAITYAVTATSPAAAVKAVLAGGGDSEQDSERLSEMSDITGQPVAAWAAGDVVDNLAELKALGVELNDGRVMGVRDVMEVD